MLKRREFLQAGAALFCAAALPARATGATQAGAGHVVVIGGGVGGATAAKYLKLANPALRVTLIEANRTYIRPYGSSEVLTGHVGMDDLNVSYDALRSRYGIEFLFDRVVGFDPARRRVRTAGKRDIAYDKLIVSPGISLQYQAIPGYSEAAAASRAPSGWIPGPQTALLARQLQAMRPGGRFVIVAPPSPYRCPPGPYERAALVTEWLARHNPTAKVIIVDPKDSFVTDAGMQLGWHRLYGYNIPADYLKDMPADVVNSGRPAPIEWLRAKDGGTPRGIDSAALRVATDAGWIKADVLNVIPPMRAGKLAFDMGLTDAGGWCPVERRTFESTAHEHVFVIGDASIADAMPKSGFSANTQAKVTAQAVVNQLAGREPGEPIWENTCYALAGSDYGLFVADVFRLKDGKIAQISGQRYLPLDASKTRIRLAARYQQAWLKTFTEDCFA
jgi:sulfide dehydrogenase [flavocytochrome c] flavoprotein subunit